MRFLPILFLLCFGVALAQTSGGTAPGGLFTTVKTQIAVRVWKHPVGADMVEVTALEPAYPGQLLRSQVEMLGSKLHSIPRGLTVFRNEISPGMSFTKATFAVDGLIDRTKHLLHISEVVQAFAGAPPPFTVTGMSIIYDGETPSANTPRSFDSRAVSLDSQLSTSPALIEYRVQLLSQDPGSLAIPEVLEQKNDAAPSKAAKAGTDWTLWSLVAISAVAVFALVYSLVLKATAKPRS